MKLITAIIRPEKLDDVKAALFREEVTGLTISRVSGHGGEKEHLETYRGRPLVFEFHEKVRLEIAVSKPFVDRTVKAMSIRPAPAMLVMARFLCNRSRRSCAFAPAKRTTTH